MHQGKLIRLATLIGVLAIALAAVAAGPGTPAHAQVYGQTQLTATATTAIAPGGTANVVFPDGVTVQFTFAQGLAAGTQILVTEYPATATVAAEPTIQAVYASAPYVAPYAEPYALTAGACVGGSYQSLYGCTSAFSVPSYGYSGFYGVPAGPLFGGFPYRGLGGLGGFGGDHGDHHGHDHGGCPAGKTWSHTTHSCV